MKPLQILINAKDNASGVFASLRAKILAAGAGLSAWFGAKSFIGAIEGAAAFEAELDSVHAALGTNAQQMQQLAQAAQNIGAASGQGAEQAAAALRTLAQAGATAEEALQALPAVADLATAAKISLSEAAEQAGSAMQAMGMGMGEGAQAIDTLVAASNASGASVKDLAAGLGKLGPAAQTLGVDITNASAWLAQLAQGGIGAQRASQALATAMGQFSNPASTFRRALAGAGITTGNFQSALGQLADKGGPGAQRAIAALGAEAGPVFAALLSQGSAGLTAMQTQLQAAGGAASSTAAIMGGNLADSMGALKSTWEGVKTALVTPLLPVIKEQLDHLGKALRELISDGSAQSMGEAFRQALQGAVQWAREAVEAIGGLGQAAGTAAAAAQTAWGVMAAGLHVVLAAVKGAGAGITALLSQLVRMGQAVAGALSSAGLGQAAQKLQEVFTGLQGAAQELGESATRSMQSAADSARQAQAGFARLGASMQHSASGAQQLQTATEQLSQSSTQLQTGQEQAGAAVEQTGRQLQGQAVSAEALAEAWQQLGITTTAELATQAQAARTAYETIRKSGAAAPQDIAQAFQVMARAVIAANNGAADAALKTQAAQHGLTIDTDEAGRAIVRSMAEAARATQSVEAAARGAARGLAQTGQAAQQAGKQAAAAHKEAAEQTESYAVALLNARDAGSEHAAAAYQHASSVVADLGRMEGGWQTWAAAVQGHLSKLKKAAGDYVQAMRRIDAQQKALEQGQSNAAQGVEALRQRLLQLSGSEEDIARDKARREMEQTGRDIALMELERERTRIRGDKAAHTQASEELALLREQKKLLGEIHRAEESQRQQRQRQQQQQQQQQQRQAAATGATEATAGTTPAGNIHITLNANGVSDPARLARMIEPELTRMALRAR